MKGLRCQGCGEYRLISDDLNFKNCPNCQCDNITICNIEVKKEIKEDVKPIEVKKEIKIEPLNEQSLEKKIIIDGTKKAKK
jgi:hypothetical protein